MRRQLNKPFWEFLMPIWWSASTTTKENCNSLLTHSHHLLLTGSLAEEDWGYMRYWCKTTPLRLTQWNNAFILRLMFLCLMSIPHIKAATTFFALSLEACLQIQDMEYSLKQTILHSHHPLGSTDVLEVYPKLGGLCISSSFSTRDMTKPHFSRIHDCWWCWDKAFICSADLSLLTESKSVISWTNLAASLLKKVYIL